MMASCHRSAIFCLILTVILNAYPSLCESITEQPCKQKGQVDALACKVENVAVNPCPEAANDKPCKLKYNSNATISFDYTPEFNATNAYSRAYWDQTFVDLPFLGMNTDACDFTACPIRAGVKQSYAYSLPIVNKYPKGEYLVKWKLWTEDKKQCCFKIRISIGP